MSKSEKGHVNNNAAYEKIISLCKGFKEFFNPTKKAIKIAFMEAQLLSSQEAVRIEKGANIVWKVAVVERKIVYKPVKKLVTRILGALKSSEVSDEIIENAKTFTRKIQGTRAVSKPKKNGKALTEPVSEGDKTETFTDEDVKLHKFISANQTGFDHMLENMGKLCFLLEIEPAYMPNEKELQVSVLNAILVDMKTKNSAVITADTDVFNARTVRNKILYAEKTGICDTVHDVKEYVKSVFGASSPEYKAVNKIRFTKLH